MGFAANWLYGRCFAEGQVGVSEKRPRVCDGWPCRPNADLPVSRLQRKIGPVRKDLAGCSLNFVLEQNASAPQVTQLPVGRP